MYWNNGVLEYWVMIAHSVLIQYSSTPALHLSVFAVRKYHSGGSNMGKVYYAVLPSKLLGKIFVASTEKGVCRLDFHTSENKFLKELRKNVSGEIVKSPRMNQKALSQLKKYVEGRLKQVRLSVGLAGDTVSAKGLEGLVKDPLWSNTIIPGYCPCDWPSESLSSCWKCERVEPRFDHRPLPSGH